MSVIHVFDFDGTIFRSPVPHKRVEKHGPKTYERLTQPVSSGGFGWFQSHLTLLPPYVPEHLCNDGEPTHFDESGNPLGSLFIEPVCEHFKALNGSIRFVMTGRDESYRPIIERILARAGLSPQRTILKPKKDSGTVRYKVENFLSMIADHPLPVSVNYYEDREEQGMKITAAVRWCQWLMGYVVNTWLTPAAGSVDLWKQYWLVERDNVLESIGCPSPLLQSVPSYHRRAYFDFIFHRKILQRVFSFVGQRPEIPPPHEVEFGRKLPSPIAGPFEEAVTKSTEHFFRFDVNYVHAEWSTDSFLREDLEDALLKQLDATDQRQTVP